MTHCHLLRAFAARLLAAATLLLLTRNFLSAEVIFQDFFRQAGSITSSVPWLDVQGNGWELDAPEADLEVDGQGHLFNPSTSKGAAVGVQLIPIGPHGSFAVSADVQLPVGSEEWLGLGFGNSNQFLAGNGSQSGPWLKVQGNGSITLYGGTGENNALVLASAYTNNGSPVRFRLTYDAFIGSASVDLLTAGLTNTLWSTVPVTNSLPTILARYLIFQFPSNSAPAAQRWVGNVAVDWYPRPRPLLSLPTAPSAHVVQVGAPTGQSDIQSIQNALDTAAGLSPGAEVRFDPGATYVISNSSKASVVALSLAQATNVLVNGNGCKILITNPRIGFLDIVGSMNVIVQGFSVDYDPLPFTQGVVTTNLLAQGAFEFRVDAGYPSPTNSDYTDIQQWGTFMDPTRPGRLADNHSTIYEFSAVAATGLSDVFRVKLSNRTKLSTIQAGDIWCQLSRWNGSPLFRARNSYQITFLNLTNYAGAAAAFAGNACSLVNEVNCQVVIGPSPGGSNGVARVKTTNADGGFFVNPRVGPWVEGCNFIGLSDDVANANTLPFFIAGPVGQPTNTFHVIGYTPGGALADLGGGEIQAGDDISFYNGTNGVVLDRALVTRVDPPYVTFDHVISGVFPGQDTTNTLIFDNSLNTSAVYLNNQFSNSRIHGIYCRANNILIAHNLITGMGTSAIAAHPALSLSGPNSFIPTNVVIMANVLADGGCSYEAINNTDPDEEPTWALLQLHKAIATTDYIPQGQEISGIRILNNAFLEWRRGAITLHNVSDAHIMGNYFGPPMTNNGLADLTNHVAADLWSCDYQGLRFENNVKADVLPTAHAIREDGQFASIPNAFQPLASSPLAIEVATSNVIVGWTSSAPGFVVQQTDTLGADATWADVLEFPYIAGASNVVSLPFADETPSRFYRTRQR